MEDSSEPIEESVSTKDIVGGTGDVDQFGNKQCDYTPIEKDDKFYKDYFESHQGKKIVGLDKFW